MLDQSSVNFYFGEVIENKNTYSKKSTDPNILFPITVKVKQNNNIKIIENVKPIFANIKQIPTVGETVLIFQGYNHTTSNTQRYLQWYYFPPVGIQSNINNNILPINSDVFTPDAKFTQKTVNPLQPYAGDILVEGRYGNTIRLGSTVLNQQYDTVPTWTGKTAADPIIILSNTRKSNTSAQYDIENVNTDDSSLYLTSTQTLNNLKLSKTLSTYQNFNGSQFIGKADRIILSSKKDLVVLDSPKGIVLNTTGNVHIGDDRTSQSLVHGNVLLDVLQKILNQLNTPIQCGTMTGTFLDKSNINSAQRNLKNLISSTYFLKKNTY